MPRLLFVLIFLPHILLAQTFREKTPTPFENVVRSSIAFSDVDGDGDQDVLIAGENNSGTHITKLYTNQGRGSFLEVTGTPFDGVRTGSIDFADMDNDGDEDVLIMGETNSRRLIAKLYTNDGSGMFTEVKDTPFEGTRIGSMAISDVDNDGDYDVLIAGQTAFYKKIAKMYTNDGTGTFAEVADTPFEGVQSASVAFADIDGDGDQDVLISGTNSSFSATTNLYTNNGNGNFTEVTAHPFDQFFAGSISFSDVDGDDDQDVLIAGAKSFSRIAKLYTNDGRGNFTEVTNTSFEGIMLSSIAFSDVDKDGDQDVLITGETRHATNIAKLYTNDGNGNFTEVKGTPFEGVTRSSIDFSDINNDGDQDILITGMNVFFEGISKLYTNLGVTTATNDLNVESNLHYILFPNPAKPKTLFLQYKAQDHQTVVIKIFNINGVLIKQQKEHAVIGQQTISINISSLASGTYLLKLDNGNWKSNATFIVR